MRLVCLTGIVTHLCTQQFRRQQAKMSQVLSLKISIDRLRTRTCTPNSALGSVAMEVHTNDERTRIG